MLLLRATQAVLGGTKYGFGSPADILIGGYGRPGEWALSFQANPFMPALTSSITQALTGGPLPLVLAVLVLLGLRRTAAAVAASVPLIFLAVAFTSSYTLAGGPRGDMILYLYAIEALALLASASTRPSWRTLRWLPGILLELATVTLGLAMDGGLWRLIRVPLSLRNTPRWRLYQLGHIPRSFAERLLGVGPADLTRWLLAEGPTRPGNGGPRSRYRPGPALPRRRRAPPGRPGWGGPRCAVPTSLPPAPGRPGRARCGYNRAGRSHCAGA